MVLVRIKKLKEDAKIPSYAYEDDAGIDVFSNENYKLGPGERHSFSTGVAFELPKGYVALVWDKSGLAANYGIKTMAGVIDSGYRGEIKIVLLNTSSNSYEVKKGDKIAQILIQPVVRAEIMETDFLSSSDRGKKGFGSSGK